MSRPERQQNVLDLLEGLREIEPLKQLKQLFWTELNYQRVNQPLSRRGWTESASKALADDPVLFAGGGEDNAFHVIYCRLASDALSRGFERPVVTQLLREHPYALFVFSNKGQTDWHFLNVKYDDQVERRRLFRRITVRPGAGLRTATERVQLLDLAEINPELFGITPLAIQQRCDAAFDVEAVTKDFFSEVANWYFWALKNASFPKNAPKEADGHDHISIIRLITRLIFCWFVKEKGLIPDTLFDQQKLTAILTGFEPAKASAKQSVFYKAILQNLFFATLNTEMDNRDWTHEGRQNFMAHSLYRFRESFQKPNEALALFKNIPFLNGGLFECLDKPIGSKEKPEYIRIDGFSRRKDSQPIVPDFLFFGPEKEGEEVGLDWQEIYGCRPRTTKVRGLIHIFNRYNFTVEENTPIEQEVALDPELSGKVFENLLAAYNPETGATARKQTGSFYTPREIVNYMVDEALIACLKTKLVAAEVTRLTSSESKASVPKEKSEPPHVGCYEAKLRHLFAYTDEPHKFTAPEVDALIAAIDNLKSLDPAVGSGAFPMGILHKLVFILGKLDPRNEKWKERQIARVRDTMATADKIEDATARERAVRELEQQITGINEAFEHNELDYGRKLYLIENCIYGVDIQPIAVQIAKMRFFISLIVDQKIDDKQPNRGVLPLPNLETKFVSANTLIGIERPDTQGKLFSNDKVEKLKSDLSLIRHRMFTAKSPSTKQTLREKDKAVREALAGEIQKSLVKANEDEICQTRLDLEKALKTLDEEQSKPVQWETTRLTNLFGETEETRIDPTKDKKLRLKEQVKQLESKLLRANQRDADIDATARRLANWDPYDQNASADFFNAEWMFGLADGFDVAIANPPYGAELSEDHKELLKRRFDHIVERIRNSFLYFMGASFDIIKGNGVLCFILPNEFLFQIYMTKARRFFLDNARFMFAVNVGEDVFEAIVPTCIVAVQKAARDAYEIPVADLRGCSLDELPTRLERTQFPRTTKSVVRNAPNSIFAFNLSTGALVNKLSATFPSFESVCEDVANGICTSCDEVYIIPDEVAKKERLEANYLKPCLRGGQFNRYYCPDKTYESVLFVTDAFDATNGKRILSYLSKYKELLVRKCVEKKSGSRDWHVLFRGRYEGLYVIPKIIVRQTADRIIAAVDDQTGYYCINSVNVILVKQSHLPKIWYYIGLLNSSLLNFFYREISQEGGRVLAEVKPQRLRSLPLADSPSAAKNGIAELVKKVVAAKQKDSSADTSVLEREINKQVYALYGLTPEEIKIVEDSAK